MERWKITPSQWDEMSEDDQAQLLAYVATLADMQAWEDFLEEKKRIADKARQNVEASKNHGV